MKQRPWSDEGEKGVLGSCLLDVAIIGNLTVQPDDFYDKRNAILWESLRNQYAEGKAMDAITIGNYLKESNKLDKVGGYDRLIELQDSALVAAHSKHYEKMVLETSQLRREIDVLENGLTYAYSGDSCSEDVISALIRESETTTKDKDMDVMADEWIEQCASGSVGHFNWWCPEWTSHLGKMSSDLMILHAPRSTGKTALMLQWITESHRNGQRTPMASIEMLKKELVPRFLANIGHVNTFTMRTRGFITDDERNRASNANKELKVLQLCIRDKGMTIEDIRAWAVSESRNGADAIFIDNLLSISDGGTKYDSKTIMYDDFIRKFRDLRDLLKIPIIILAHPNESGQVAWSRDVENFADIIMFMHNVPDEGLKIQGTTIKKDFSLNKHVVGVFQKNRQGISPIASLDFEGDYQAFTHVRWEN
jgi:replicative DNA helicase